MKEKQFKYQNYTDYNHEDISRLKDLMNTSYLPEQYVKEITRIIDLLETQKIDLGPLEYRSDAEHWFYDGAIIKNPAVLQSLLTLELLQFLTRKCWYISLSEGYDATGNDSPGYMIDYGGGGGKYVAETLFETCYKTITQGVLK